MPKLDGTQIAERLQARLEELQRGEDVAARDLRALLTAEQEAVMDAALAEQQELRKQKRARPKEEEAALCGVNWWLQSEVNTILAILLTFLTQSRSANHLKVRMHI